MSVFEVVPGVYQITTWRYVNVFLLAGEKLTLIDTGFWGNTGTIVKTVENLGYKISDIELIILTHNHSDHTGGLTELRKITRARVAASYIDATFPPDSPKWLPRLANVDIPLRGGEIFDILGGLEVIGTPGHTLDSISLYLKEKKLLLVGDALAKHKDRIDPPVRNVCADVSLAAESIRKLAQLDFNTVCFGHGRPLSGTVKEKVQLLVRQSKL